jgi:hypothetical protein
MTEMQPFLHQAYQNKINERTGKKFRVRDTRGS